VNEAIRIATALARGASIHAVPLAHVKRRSSAQNQVLELVADGKNVKQIIQITGTGHSTVYRHIAALKAEFNCHSDAELMEKARKFLGRKD
jgi:DNA-binding CsgD family transcriptional regulator